MAIFKNLTIGTKFNFEQQVWVRIPKLKKCCKVLFNAQVDGNKDIKKVFDMNQEVQIYEG